MRKIDLSNWNNLEKLTTLIFFVQVLEDMLFYYNAHSNKINTTNSRILAHEARQILSRIEVEKINDSILNPVIEELKKNLLFDSVAKKLIGNKFESINKCLNSDNIQEVIRAIDALIRYFGNHQYFRKVKEELEEAIITTKSKKNILSLSKCLISELITLGYAREYIYYNLKKFFFSKDKQINSLDQIEHFFNLFNGEKKKYKVVRLVNRDFVKLIDRVQDSASLSYEREIQNKILDTVEQTFFNNKMDNQVICTFSIEAHDPFKAAKKSLDFLSLFTSVQSFYSHNKKIKWYKEALVYHGDESAIRIEAPVHLMNTRPNKKVTEALDYAVMTLNGYGLKKESRIRVFKIMELHSLAMNADSEQIQLLNLWSALEALFPVPKQEKSRIKYLIKCIVPILVKIYVVNYFKEILSEINRLVPDLVLDDIKGKNIINKFVALVCLNEYKDQRKERLYSKFLDNPYAMYKIFELHGRYSNPKNVLKTLREYEQKVGWQLHRIYRCRNEITHTGMYTLPFIANLIENLHYYLDSIVEYSQVIAKGDNGIFDFEEVVFDCRIDNTYREGELSEIGQKLTEENYEQLLIGEN